MMELINDNLESPALVSNKPILPYNCAVIKSFGLSEEALDAAILAMESTGSQNKRNNLKKFYSAAVRASQIDIDTLIVQYSPEWHLAVDDIIQKRNLVPAGKCNAITAQRDELLAALKAIYDRHNAETMAQARNVIAKCEAQS